MQRTLFVELFATGTGVVSFSTIFFFRFKGGMGFLLVFSILSILLKTELSPHDGPAVPAALDG